MKKAIALACALGALACAPAAFAGTPFTIGSGDSPHMTVEPNGTAHVVWLHGPSGDKRVAYCQVPRGATACAGPPQDLGAPPGAEAETPYVVRGAGSTLYVTQTRYVPRDTHIKTSTNGGAGWSAAWLKVHSTGSWTDAEPPLSYGNGELVFPSWNSGINVFSARVNGADGAVDTAAELGRPPGSLYNFRVVQPPGSSLVGTVDNGEGLYLYRLAGAVNNPDNWSDPNGGLIGEGRESRLASGPRGAYVASTAGDALSEHVQVRRITAGGVGGPVGLEAGTTSFGDVAVGEAGVGVVYANTDQANRRLRFALSTDEGASFPTRYDVAPFENIGVTDLDVGLGRDNQGFVLWHGTDNNEIRLATLEPYVAPPIVEPPRPPVTNPGPPRSPQSPTRTTTASVPGVPGGRIALQTPRSCVRPGATFGVTLQFKRSKTKAKKSGRGRLKVKLRRVDFYIGSKRLKIDKRAPFRQTLRVAQRQRPGSTITVRARAFIKVKKGRSPTKSVRAQVSAGVGVC